MKTVKNCKKFRKTLEDEEFQKRSSNVTKKSKSIVQNDDDDEISEIESKYGVDLKRFIRE